jgi:2-oxoglutarate dehydrogenase complex dehydrogenase (E1) component-like enzyme
VRYSYPLARHDPVHMLSAGASQVVLAMPHRGRLNLLVNVLKYPTTALFYKLKGGAEVPSNLNLSGDVVSHLGERQLRDFRIA